MESFTGGGTDKGKVNMPDIDSVLLMHTQIILLVYPGHRSDS